MEGFPIFRLPYLVQRKLIPYLDTLEQIDLSLCSKKCRALVKSTVTSNGRTITANFYEYSGVSIEVPNDMFRFFIMTDERKNLLDVKNKPMVSDQSCKNMHEWMMVWIDYICDIINCPIGYIMITIGDCYQHLQEILNWISKNCQKSIPQIDLGSSFLSQETIENDEYSFFFDNIKVTDSLQIRAKNHPNFQYELNISTKELYLGHAEWLTMNNLLNLVDCTKIELEYSNFTNEDLNLFLKQWIRNDMIPNLCYFSTEIKDLNFESIFSELEFTERRDDIAYKSNSIIGDSHAFSGGVDIQRIDGLIATILLLRHKRAIASKRPAHEEGS